MQPHHTDAAGATPALLFGCNFHSFNKIHPNRARRTVDTEALKVVRDPPGPEPPAVSSSIRPLAGTPRSCSGGMRGEGQARVMLSTLYFPSFRQFAASGLPEPGGCLRISLFNSARWAGGDRGVSTGTAFPQAKKCKNKKVSESSECAALCSCGCVRCALNILNV